MFGRLFLAVAHGFDLAFAHTQQHQRALHGFGLSNYTTGASTFMADIAPPRRRAEAMGLSAVSHDLGGIIGPAVGFWLLAAMLMKNLNVAPSL